MLFLKSEGKFYEKDLLSLADCSSEEVLDFINVGIKVKKYPERFRQTLKGKTLLMVFEKPSLRTRVSFEVTMNQMEGHAIYYDVATFPLGKKETVGDMARTVSRYVDIIMVRLNHFEDVQALAKAASVTVIDGLSDRNHPCQILGDLMTIFEKKEKIQRLNLGLFW